MACSDAYGRRELVWLAASEYVITAVNHVSYPNRVLRQGGLAAGAQEDGSARLLDLERSAAWALVDHQFSHVFVRDADRRRCERTSRSGWRTSRGSPKCWSGEQLASTASIIRERATSW